YQIDCIELKGLDKMSGHPSVKGMKQISEQVKAYMNSRQN
ncbi:MAG: SGNH/GDSL hydrolase family protein, partial [Phocaeicola vulgatus]|nr:SGNH/GDSL hydrolase family protein [Phocaeicola vulgatus]